MFAAALIYILAVMSPGPNFLLVTRFASSGSVRAGLGATAGIVLVGLIFSSSSVTGLSVLIRQIPAFDKVAGAAAALYLVAIAALLVRGALKPASPAAEGAEPRPEARFWRAFRIGALTNVGNVKTIAFMVSIFTGFLVVERSGSEKAAIVALCSTLEFGWYAGVAFIFGRGAIRTFYARHNRLIDLFMAVFLVGFAAKTAAELL
ncbi:LysE family translocator [Methylobacterium pseudosasicola]|uniref:Threonine/homoserine/homoserine lactone efflux protein n=1 Tax=Methylobacterium pseudosasicola TaxID=582667 RepID=A0A1I4NFN1_9HYPH|nr:LysE family transporter [Methylobacterium pseudosasicola]SFM14311.1 Threonine/homoserine/homoserine lactone efflux protein [Methylobacterium pseudosasicola]